MPPILPVLLLALGAGLLVVRALSPKSNSVILPAWPSAAWLSVQAIVSLVFKPRRAVTLAATANAPKLEVTLGRPVGVEVKRFQAFMALAGHSGVGTAGALPIMYPMAEAFRLSIQVMGSVLARNTTVMTRPIAVDEKLFYSVRVEPGSWRATSKGDVEVDLVCVCAAARDAAVVWRSTTTVILLNPKRARGPVPGTAPQPLGAGSGEAEWQVAGEWRLGGDVGRKYGMLTGDLNPIHLHPVLSRLFGFKRPIAHALFIVARTEAALRAHGVQIEYPVELSAEFKRPTMLPATLRCLVAPAIPKEARHFRVVDTNGGKEVLIGSLGVAAASAS